MNGAPVSLASRRKVSVRQRYLRRGLYSLVGLTVLAGITFGLSRLKPAAPTADWSLVVIDTVKRGSLIRQERGREVMTE